MFSVSFWGLSIISCYLPLFWSMYGIFAWPFNSKCRYHMPVVMDPFWVPTKTPPNHHPTQHHPQSTGRWSGATFRARHGQGGEKTVTGPRGFSTLEKGPRGFLGEVTGGFLSGWWQLRYFWTCSPVCGEDEPILTPICFEWVGSTTNYSRYVFGGRGNQLLSWNYLDAFFIRFGKVTAEPPRKNSSINDDNWQIFQKIIQLDLQSLVYLFFRSKQQLTLPETNSKRPWK